MFSFFYSYFYVMRLKHHSNTFLARNRHFKHLFVQYIYQPCVNQTVALIMKIKLSFKYHNFKSLGKIFCIILAQNMQFQVYFCHFLIKPAHHRLFILEKFHRWWKENTAAQQMYLFMFRCFISCAVFNLASSFRCFLNRLFISHLCSALFSVSSKRSDVFSSSLCLCLTSGMCVWS